MAGADSEDEPPTDAVVRALAELKVATEARRMARRDSAELLAAARREREIMERIWALVHAEDRVDG